MFVVCCQKERRVQIFGVLNRNYTFSVSRTKNVAEVKSKACASKYKYTNWRLYSHNPGTDRK